MIPTAGYNVYPPAIERGTMSHPAVALVGVGRAPDAAKGEVAHAYLVLAAGHGPDTNPCSRIAASKAGRIQGAARRSLRRQELPTTSTGKLMRRKLRSTAVES